jgi:ATP-dependent DNA ligase
LPCRYSTSNELQLTVSPAAEQAALALKAVAKYALRPSLLYGQHIRGRGGELFNLICKIDAEGITIKDASAPYGISARWFKVRNRNYWQWEGRHDYLKVSR